MSRQLLQVTVLLGALIMGGCGSETVDVAADGGGQAAEASDSDTVTRLWIKPETVDCIGEMPQQCMQVAEAEDGEYLYFYDQIAGFEFVEGTTYVVDVRIEDVANPPADSSSLAYTLVEVIEER